MRISDWSSDVCSSDLGDQLHAVRGAQLAQRRERLVPLPPRLVRIDGVGGDQLAGGVDHRDLDPGAQAGIEPEHRLRTGGRGQQQVLEVVAAHVDRLALGLLRSEEHTSALQSLMRISYAVFSFKKNKNQSTVESTT